VPITVLSADLPWRLPNKPKVLLRSGLQGGRHLTWRSPGRERWRPPALLKVPSWCQLCQLSAPIFQVPPQNSKPESQGQNINRFAPIFNASHTPSRLLASITLPKILFAQRTQITSRTSFSSALLPAFPLPSPISLPPFHPKEYQNDHRGTLFCLLHTAHLFCSPAPLCCPPAGVVAELCAHHLSAQQPLNLACDSIIIITTPASSEWDPFTSPSEQSCPSLPCTHDTPYSCLEIMHSKNPSLLPQKRTQLANIDPYFPWISSVKGLFGPPTGISVTPPGTLVSTGDQSM
jgi:hypothetical protein